MEKHVLFNGFARLDEVRILSRLDRKKPNWTTANCTVFRPNRTDTAVYFLATAASTGRNCTNGHASNAEGTGDLNA
jgi:hypothetical protein